MSIKNVGWWCRSSGQFPDQPVTNAMLNVHYTPSYPQVQYLPQPEKPNEPTLTTWSCQAEMSQRACVSPVKLNEGPPLLALYGMSRCLSWMIISHPISGRSLYNYVVIDTFAE